MIETLHNPDKIDAADLGVRDGVSVGFGTENVALRLPLYDYQQINAGDSFPQ